jgi:uncharacterized protein YceK
MTVAAQLAYMQDGEESFDGWPCGTVYMGTRVDVLLVRGEVCCFGVGVVVQTLAAMDFPLSLAADTALLPLTIAETIALTRRRRQDDELARAEAER